MIIHTIQKPIAMKNLVIIFLLSLFMQDVLAQCKNPYFKVKSGTVMVMESYNRKDKLDSKSTTEVINFTEIDDGFAATLAYKIIDKKDKTIAEGEYEMTCKDNVVKLDMSGFLPAENMQAFKDMEIDVTMNQLEYPANLSPGQMLNDASIEIATKNGPIPMKLIFDITDRKVEGNETITTPAGTFDCSKITYNSHSKMMMANMNFTNVEYLSKEAGAVKTETYRSNGKLIGYTLLTEYKY
jgi:hypothetical protein